MSNFSCYIHELFITWMIVSVKGTHHEHVRRKKDEESSILSRHQVPAGLNTPAPFPPSEAQTRGRELLYL